MNTIHLTKSVFLTLSFSLALQVSTILSYAQDCPEVEYSNDLVPDSVFASEVEGDLAERRISIHVADESFATVVYRLAFDYGVRIGFEESPLDRKDGHFVFEPYLYVTRGRINRCHPAEQLDAGSFGITLNAENQKLGVVLDDLVRQMRNYKWEVRDGMVNLVPSDKRDSMIEAFLELRIAEFRFRAGRKIIHLFEDLRNTTEIQDFRKSNRIEFRMNRGSIIGDGLNFVLRTEIEFKGLTVRELLNRLGKLNQVGWIIRAGPEESSRQIILGI